MNLDFDSLSEDEILAVIRRAGVAPKKGNIHLQRYPSNSSRRDTRQRISFRIWQAETPTVHLIVGRGLSGLHRRAEAFHRHNPGLAARPLYFVQHAGVDYFGQECVGVLNLDEALTEKRIDATQWLQVVRQVADALGATTQPSRLTLLMRELAEFEASVAAIPSLTHIDAVFLRESVFPLLRFEASKLAPVTTWTNGDFITRNIVLDAAGHPRLIDYEFAQRTHFHQQDWFRFGHFSSHPPGIKPEDLAPGLPLPPWLEIRGWLEHAVKMNQICAPAVAQADLAKISARVTELVENQGGLQAPPVFFDFSRAANGAARELMAPVDTLAVEWTRQGSSQFLSEPPVTLQPRNWSEVRVDLSGAPGRMPRLRLRLPAAPCVIELRGMEVYGRQRDQILWAVDSSQMRTVVSCTGTVLDLPTLEGLGLIQLGGESFVTLPPIHLNRSVTSAGLAVWVRYVPDLHDFSQRLRRAFSDGEMPALLTGENPLLPAAGSADSRITAQLFFPEGDVYSEVHATCIEIREFNTWAQLEFEVPPQPEGAILRFDPTNHPGVFEIADLALSPVALEAGLRQLPHSWLEGLQCEGEALLLPDEDNKCLLIFGHDPILKLAPLPARWAGRPLRLTVSFRFHHTPAIAVWAAAFKEQHHQIFGLHQRLQVSSEMAESARRFADHEATARLQGEADRTDTLRERDVLQAETERLKQETDRLEAEVATLQRQIVARTKQQDSVQAELRAQMATAESASQQARKDVIMLQEQRESDLAEARLRQSELEALKGNMADSERDRRAAWQENERLCAHLAEQQAAAKQAAARHNTEATTQLAQLRLELQAAGDREVKLKAEVQQLQSDHSVELATAMQAAASHDAEATIQLAQLRQEIHVTTEREARLTAEVRQLESDRQVAQASALQAAARIEELQEEVNASASKISTQAAGLEHLGSQLAETALRQKELASNFAAELDAARARAEQLEQLLHTERADHRETIQCREAAQAETAAQLAAALKRLESLGTETGNLSTRVKDLSDRNDTLAESLYAQNSRLIDQEQVSLLIVAERERLADELKVAAGKIRELTDTLSNLQQRKLLQLDRGAIRLLREALGPNATSSSD